MKTIHSSEASLALKGEELSMDLPLKRRPMKTYLVHGCGVSAICQSQSGVTYWISEIINRGGVPSVTCWAQEGR